LPRPRARAISVFAAQSPTMKRRIPALHIETTVREIPRNVARMVVCMWMPSLSSRALSGARFPGSIQLQIVQRRVGDKFLPGALPLPAVGKGGGFDFPGVAVHPANHAGQNQRQKPHPNVEQRDVRMGHPRDSGWESGIPPARHVGWATRRELPWYGFPGTTPAVTRSGIPNNYLVSCVRPGPRQSLLP